GIQIHGGMGYVEETGAAQYYRDIRIAPIYEGTNGIQAIDLVMRKLPMAGGEVAHRLVDAISETAERLQGVSALERFGMHLEDGVEAVDEGIQLILERMGTEPNDALSAATPFLRLFGTVIGGWLMGKAALAAHEQLEAETGDADFLRRKLATARFYGEQIMPTAYGLIEAVESRSDALFEIPDEGLRVDRKS